jgi:hypothetical protein
VLRQNIVLGGNIPVLKLSSRASAAATSCPETILTLRGSYECMMMDWE